MSDPRASALLRLFDANVALFHCLRAAAEQAHGEGEASAARRGILRGLERSGPRTVPQMARARRVSRQHIQVLVNGLVADGLLEAAPNPAHKRSPLIRLSQAGRLRLRRIASTEDSLLARLPPHPGKAALIQAAETLETLRGSIEQHVLGAGSAEIPASARNIPRKRSGRKETSRERSEA